jgi:hypothetical protein
MTIANPTKALILLVGLICLTCLCNAGRVDMDNGVPILTLVIGYAVGNGVGARQGQDSQPIIGEKRLKE